MQSSALTGCAISCALAFIILTITTTNIILALYSMLCIAAVIVSAIGYIVLVGWKFGTMEAICVTICVGFSVDFVVHIAIAYQEADLDTRYDRARKALADVGISVTAACISTIGASCFMLPAPMIPFMKMGAFIMFDIFVSLFSAV